MDMNDDLNNNKDKEILKWRMVHGLFTPGGDPAYICPKCNNENSFHINGIESLRNWNYCPCCEVRLTY